jgi:hypothetical protein
MNSRRLGLVVMAVNLGLLGTLAYIVFTTRLRPSLAAPAERARATTNTVTQIAVRKVNATNLLEALASRALNWHMLESSNYVLYIENLRNFGCPDETIRDIIITDVAKLYARRRAELRAQAPPQKFWHPVDALQADSSGLQAQLRALDQEQRDLIRELLGVDLRAEMTKYWNEEDYQNFGDEYLPADKKNEVQALQQKYDELEQDIYTRTRGLLLDEDQAALRTLRREREAELAALLTPEELEEYQLRHSETADNMRAQLVGFNVTEEEFRKIFRLQKSFDADFNQLFDPTDDSAMEIKARAQEEAQAALNEELKKTLGPERYAEYVRAQDNDYKTLLQVSERFDLSRDVANRVYSMKVLAEQQRQQIEANPNLTDDQRAAALLAIARETERSVSGALGENVFKSYQKAGGQWLSSLFVVPEPPPAPEPPPPPTLALPPLPPDVIRSLLFNAPPPPQPQLQR